MERLTQGTIENLIVLIEDQLDVLTDLTGTNPKYDVYEHNNPTPKIDNAAANFTGMKVYCLIDTTQPTLWSVGLYELFVRLTVTPEVPRLGPFKFRVDK